MCAARLSGWIEDGITISELPGGRDPEDEGWAEGGAGRPEMGGPAARSRGVLSWVPGLLSGGE